MKNMCFKELISGYDFQVPLLNGKKGMYVPKEWTCDYKNIFEL